MVRGGDGWTEGSSEGYFNCVTPGVNLAEGCRSPVYCFGCHPHDTVKVSPGSEVTS